MDKELGLVDNGFHAFLDDFRHDLDGLLLIRFEEDLVVVVGHFADHPRRQSRLRRLCLEIFQIIAQNVSRVHNHRHF